MQRILILQNKAVALCDSLIFYYFYWLTEILNFSFSNDFA